jgi:hypothetical protein
MDKRILILMVIVLIMAFVFGYVNSYSTGIQPGYFEKAEAPAYGVGGGDTMGAGMDEEFQEHLKKLYEDSE